MTPNQTAILRLELGFLSQLLGMAQKSVSSGATEDVQADLQRAREVLERVFALLPKLQEERAA